jgi:hypothetical protein
MTHPYPHVRHYGVDPLTPEEGEHLLAREVLQFSFYLPHDHPDLATGVSHAFDCYMKAVGEGPDTLNHCSFGCYDHGPLCEERWERIRQLLLPDRPFRYAEECDNPYRIKEMEKSGTETWIHLSSGHGSLNGFTLTYAARVPFREQSPSDPDVSYLEGTLPTEYLEKHGPSAVGQLALEMASGLNFATGHMGLAFALRPPAGPSRVREELLRYPGISHDQGSPARWMGTRVDGVHWLNFLGSPVLGELGGVAALRSRLRSPDTTVRELDGARAVVTLGEWPEAGDLTQGQALPAYRELARVLEPWLDRYFNDPGFRIPGFTQEEALRWARRFLD